MPSSSVFPPPQDNDEEVEQSVDELEATTHIEGRVVATGQVADGH